MLRLWQNFGTSQYLSLERGESLIILTVVIWQFLIKLGPAQWRVNKPSNPSFLKYLLNYKRPLFDVIKILAFFSTLKIVLRIGLLLRF